MNNSESLQRFRHDLNRTRPFMSGIDWRADDFTPEKAYVTAVFSKIAYLEIPEFEVPHHPLAKIIPCLTYWDLISQRASHSAKIFMEPLDFGDVFVVTRNDVIAVGVVGPYVTIVALRGTRPLYLSDWLVDLRASRTTGAVNGNAVRFHSGFYLAITSCIAEIAKEIDARAARRQGSPIYIVGHSLGGAMAAIARALDGLPYYSTHWHGLTAVENLGLHSGFTFGMPRYGDASAIFHLRQPYHSYNEHDAVPGMPARVLGFDNPKVEHWITRDGTIVQTAQRPHESGAWVGRVLLAEGIRHHFVEHYIHQLGVAANVYR